MHGRGKVVPNMRKIALFSGAASAYLTAGTAYAQFQDGDDPETIFVVGERRAYQGSFGAPENPTVSRSLDLALLREVGALKLKDALDSLRERAANYSRSNSLSD